MIAMIQTGIELRCGNKKARLGKASAGHKDLLKS